MNVLAVGQLTCKDLTPHIPAEQTAVAELREQGLFRDLFTKADRTSPDPAVERLRRRRGRRAPLIAAAPATSVARPPPKIDGKEGVDGSSPSEGSAKAPHVGDFALRSTCRVSSVRWVWSRQRDALATSVMRRQA
jgi:hypothetical protein